MSDLDKVSTVGTHQRKESRFSEGSNGVSDYEYFTNSTGDHGPISTMSPAPEYSQYHMSPSLGRPATPQEKAEHPAPLGTHPAHYRNASPDREGGYPEVATPPASQAGKEYYNRNPYGDKEAYTAPVRMGSQPDSSYHSQEGVIDETPRKTRSGCCGMSKKVCCILTAVILAIAIALGVGLGVGLSKSKSHNNNSSNSNTNEALASQTMIGGTINPEYYSTAGAFNGSGVAIASVNFGFDSSIFVFYQQYDGDIVQLLYAADGQWTFVTTVASNARNATSISAVAYISEGIAYWHVFYFDENRYVKQRTSSNSSAYQANIWTDGLVNSLNLQGNDAELVGLQACYWGNYYGSATNWTSGNFTTPAAASPQDGMNLWYGSDNSTFQQYDFTAGDSSWNFSQSWTGMNTHAGVGCQSWLTGATYYVFMVDSSNNLRIYWKDTDHNETSTASHPIDKWSNTSVVIPNVHPSTSIGYTDFMVWQANDNTFHGANVTWAAENTTIANAQPGETGINGLDEWALQAQDAGVPGSHMAITGLNGGSGGREEVIFYQQTGNDIRWGIRDSQAGDFAYNEVPMNLN